MIGFRSHAARHGLVGMASPRSRASYVSCMTWLSLSVCFASLTGCGAATYSYNVVLAERSVQQAKQVGAETRAPHEMTLATAYLAKSREESAEASYQDAVRFAKLARALAARASERSRGKRFTAPGAGR